MIPNHQQLLGLLERTEPAFLAGQFATDFIAAPEAEGERGTFLYFEGGFWDIHIDGAARFLLAPWGSRVIEDSGEIEDGPAMTTLPRRPPWSLVLPRWSTFLGRADDDLQLNAAMPLVEDGPSWVAQMTSLERPHLGGTLTVSSEAYVITKAEMGHMVQTLAITRTTPTDDDLAALEAIKTTVKEFSGG